MKIIIDIGHPAHVHYFKNLIRILQEKGHVFLVFARERYPILNLLDYYNITYIKRGKGKKSIIGKILYLIWVDIFILKHARIFKPDILMCFGAVYLSHIASILGKPCLFFDDTEHAILNHFFYRHFAKHILTPSCFKRNFGKKHLRFNSYMELCYLHPNYFKPDPTVLNLLGVKKGGRFVIIRFVSWDASHDRGEKGIDNKTKLSLLNELLKKNKVFISSEDPLPPEFEPYRIEISPEKIHQVLAFTTLFIGEGATMASECAMLGTPAIYVNSLTAGTIEEQEKYGLLFSYRTSEGILQKALELLRNKNLKEDFQNLRKKMLRDKINVTSFLIWLIENYPDSISTIRSHTNYQNNFRSLHK